MHYHFIELVYASLRLDNPSDTMKNEYIYTIFTLLTVYARLHFYSGEHI